MFPARAGPDGRTASEQGGYQVISAETVEALFSFPLQTSVGRARTILITNYTFPLPSPLFQSRPQGAALVTSLVISIISGYIVGAVCKWLIPGPEFPYEDREFWHEPEADDVEYSRMMSNGEDRAAGATNTKPGYGGAAGMEMKVRDYIV